MFQDGSDLGNLGGFGQLDGGQSVEHLLKLTNKQQLQQQVVASEELNSMQRQIDLSKVAGGGVVDANGLVRQNDDFLSPSANSAERQAALLARLQASQQQFVDNQFQAKPESNNFE